MKKFDAIKIFGFLLAFNLLACEQKSVKEESMPQKVTEEKTINKRPVVEINAGQEYQNPQETYSQTEEPKSPAEYNPQETPKNEAVKAIKEKAIEEEKASGLEEKLQEAGYVINFGPVIRAEIADADSGWQISEASIKLLDRYGEEIKYFKGDKNIAKFPYNARTKEGIVVFNVLPGDTYDITQAEIKAPGYYLLRSIFPLKELLKYNATAFDSLPEEIAKEIKFKYIKEEADTFLIDWESENEFYSKIKSKDFRYNQPGPYILVPVKFEMKKIPFEVEQK